MIATSYRLLFSLVSNYAWFSTEECYSEPMASTNLRLWVETEDFGIETQTINFFELELALIRWSIFLGLFAKQNKF